jgi:hypothetical protein
MAGPDRNGHACRSPHRGRPHTSSVRHARDRQSTAPLRCRTKTGVVQQRNHRGLREEMLRFDRDVIGVARKVPTEARTSSRACRGPFRKSGSPNVMCRAPSATCRGGLRGRSRLGRSEPAVVDRHDRDNAGTDACSPGLPRCTRSPDVRLRAEVTRTWRAAAARRGRHPKRNACHRRPRPAITYRGHEARRRGWMGLPSPATFPRGRPRTRRRDVPESHALNGSAQQY